MFNMLESTGIDKKDLRIVQNLYYKQTAGVAFDGEISDFFNIQKGVRQGCVLSPDLFNLYSEHIFREIQDERGVMINGENINNVKYADDTILMAHSQQDLQNLLDRIVDASRRKGLFLNVKKTECMVVSKNKPTSEPNMTLVSNGETIKQVEKFNYLGSMITSDARDIKAIRIQIGKAKSAFGNLKNVLMNSKISMKTKLSLVTTFVLSTLLYGCETWTMLKEAEDKLQAMEMWIYRRLQKISWTAKMSNEEVLRKLGKERKLLKTIRQRQMNFFGHICRNDSLEKLALTGAIAGTRDKGRQRTTYVSSLRESTSNIPSNNEFIRATNDRSEWRHMIGNVPNGTGHAR